MIDSVAIDLGPITVYWYSLFILLGIVLGYYLARPAAQKAGITPEQLQLSIFFGVIPGIIGARLYHVIDQWSRYSHDLGAAFAINNGGLGILGGLAGGALGLYFFCRWERIKLLSLLDAWAPSVLLGQALGRFGNWTNQEAFGPPTNLPWKVAIDPANRPTQYAGDQFFHPTFFYEAGFDLLGLAVLLYLRPRFMKKPGAVLGLYFIIYGLGRFLVEFYRFDTAQIYGVAVAHVVAVALVALGIWLFRRPAAKPASGRRRPSRS